ncbi:MAG: zinc ribbon domain-containing protein [Candidatus Omnitrophota bacterium]|jgi:hypothetical protein
MKKCPFCAEEIREEALKCRFCGEFLDKQPQFPLREPWYCRTFVIVLAFVTVGPLALPLVWKHPRYSLRTKMIVTIIVLLLTYITVVLTVKSVHFLTEYYKLLL